MVPEHGVKMTDSRAQDRTQKENGMNGEYRGICTAQSVTRLIEDLIQDLYRLKIASP